jgi:hypothetical protein
MILETQVEAQKPFPITLTFGQEASFQGGCDAIEIEVETTVGPQTLVWRYGNPVAEYSNSSSEQNLDDATGLEERVARAAYLAQCPPACVAHGGDLATCVKACTCVADRAQAAGLPLSAARADAAGEPHTRLRDIVETCSLIAR